VKDTSARLAIDDRKARAIATDINRDVFEAFKQILRDNEETAAKEYSVSSLERAGGFEIEKDFPGGGEKGIEKTNAEAAAMTETDKINMLSDIENPKPIAERITSEPLVDQLLHAPAAIPEEKIMVKAEPPANLPTDDPYREPTR
jgi:hypothetical protein